MTLVDMPLYDRCSLAQATLDAGQPLEAARLLQPVVDELTTSGLVLLARALFGSAQLDRAAEVLQRVVDRDPTDSWARFVLGRVEQRRGRYAEALPHLRLAVALSPDLEHRERLAEVEALVAGRHAPPAR